MSKSQEIILEKKGIRPTAMRVLVLQYMQTEPRAISLNELEVAMSHSDRVTLYRTLKTFEAKGIVHRIDDGSGIAKFALSSDEFVTGNGRELHIHFYCNNCRETYCLPKVRIAEVSMPPNYQLQEISLMGKGICDKCCD